MIFEKILKIIIFNHPKSKLFMILEDNLGTLDCKVKLLDRKYWTEDAGLQYIQQLPFVEDVKALNVSTTGNYFAVCCIAAASAHAI